MHDVTNWVAIIMSRLLVVTNKQQNAVDTLVQHFQESTMGRENGHREGQTTHSPEKKMDTGRDRQYTHRIVITSRLPTVAITRVHMRLMYSAPRK